MCWCQDGAKGRVWGTSLNHTTDSTSNLGVVSPLHPSAHISLHTWVLPARLVPSEASHRDTPGDVLVCWWITGTSMGDEFEPNEYPDPQVGGSAPPRSLCPYLPSHSSANCKTGTTMSLIQRHTWGCAGVLVDQRDEYGGRV